MIDREGNSQKENSDQSKLVLRTPILLRNSHKSSLNDNLKNSKDFLSWREPPSEEFENYEDTVKSDISSISKLFCKKCGKCTPAVLTRDQDLWKTIGNFLKSFKCCGKCDTQNANFYAYACVKCGSVVAKLRN